MEGIRSVGLLKVGNQWNLMLFSQRVHGLDLEFFASRGRVGTDADTVQ